MTHGSVQQIQIILQAQLLKMCARRGVQLRAFAAVAHIDLVHITHQLYGLLLAHVLIKRAAEIVGDIIFSVGKSARTAETAHNGTAGTAHTGLHLIAVYGTVALL